MLFKTDSQRIRRYPYTGRQVPAGSDVLKSITGTASGTFCRALDKSLKIIVFQPIRASDGKACYTDGFDYK